MEEKEITHNDPIIGKSTRRDFLIRTTFASISVALAPLFPDLAATSEEEKPEAIPIKVTTLNFKVNNKEHTLEIDPRSTLLDTLRENLKLTGTKKGCDHGQCGACTVLVNGRRINSCLRLSATCSHADVTTIEGIADGSELHPIQEAFIRHDASAYGNTIGTPALFTRQLFDKLFDLRGDDGAKKIINKYLHTLVAVGFPMGHIDVDTVEDYDLLLLLSNNY